MPAKKVINCDRGLIESAASQQGVDHERPSGFDCNDGNFRRLGINGADWHQTHAVGIC